MALHEQCVGATDEWYTPPYVFEAMGVAFDLDAASPMHGLPWIPAAHRYSCESLDCRWDGFVWMNAPFGGRNGLLPWLEKFHRHNNGVALVPDRTSAPWWQVYARKMDAVLFVSPKIKFIGIDGETGRSPAQGTTLFALGDRGRQALCNAERSGLGILLENVRGYAVIDDPVALRAQLTAAKAENARLRHILTAIRDNAADPETVLANVDAALAGGTDAG